MEKHADNEGSGDERSSVAQPMELWPRYCDTPYLIGPQIAKGGMGTVHAGLRQGALGFRRYLAIKRLHSHLVDDPEFVARFKREIKLVSRIAHPNVVTTCDVLETSDGLALVMEYVHGVTLHALMRHASSTSVPIPIDIGVAVIVEALLGLHAAHGVVDDEGQMMGLVHRDVSPQNVMVGTDGTVKVLDFGIATAATEMELTKNGRVAGKIAYMSPEQIRGRLVDRRTDIFSTGVMLWEVLAGRRLFRRSGQSHQATERNVTSMGIPSLREIRDDVPPELERVVIRALQRDPVFRFSTAKEFALALQTTVARPSSVVVAAWVARTHEPRQEPSLIPSGRRETEPPVEPASVAPTALHVPARGASSAPPEWTPAPSSTLSLDNFRPKRRSLWLVTLCLLLLAGVVLALTWEKGSVSTQPSASPVVSDPENTIIEASGSVPRVSGSVDSHSLRARGVAATSGTEAKAPAAATGSVTPRLAGQKTQSRAIKRRKSTPRHLRRKAKAKARKAPAKKAPAKKAPAKKAPAKATTPPKPVKQNSCSPPTFTDRQGIRHFKPECL